LIKVRIKIMKSSLLLLVILFGCKQEGKLEISIGKSKKPLILNPLDAVLGDKILRESNNIIRPNNFQSLINLPIIYLYLESELYNIKRIDSNLFLLMQKKLYTEARNFNILLAVDGEKIIRYYVVNDFEALDVEKRANEIFLLCSNLNNKNEYWRLHNEVKVLKINLDLNVIWEYRVKQQKYPLDASNFIVTGPKTKFVTHVITGCTICYSCVSVEVDENGKYLSANLMHSQGGPHQIIDWELDGIFRSTK
jgi:hypothetical protein